MDVMKDSFVLDLQRDQLVDIEESSIIELLRRNFPERKPIMLLRQQAVEKIEAFRVARHSIEGRQIDIEMLFDFRRSVVELPKHAFDEQDLLGAVAVFLRRGNIFERVKNAEKFDEIEIVGAETFSERIEIVGQQLTVGFDIERQLQRKIAHPEAVLIVV